MQRRYDRQIIIQRKTVTQSGSGEEVETWADLCYKCLAFVAPTKGSEKFANPENVASQETTFTIRFHEIASASRPLGPEDRIIYPVDGIAANAQSPAWNLVHDIISSDEVGRQVDLSIKTLRRADVTT
ncbi:head-tail adaptor protein [Bradyrhizobium sp. AUGA SZCCT0176]|uniref:head-tail adaptor protein n=1 Tax=Bradyrhizobium sp. AUGA SZCCT0176 TaxID=2807664 RepID=UPI001BA5642F|nr:head-tail adaptor protein [Bradyrhizobium sp. AUGA SZCCT0176]MBR1230208.1 head-tail adaptor protein [Bradyrhizobium sp. AUGA SZCCT0176]